MTGCSGGSGSDAFLVCSVVLCVLVLLLFLFPYCQGSCFASGHTP